LIWLGTVSCKPSAGGPPSGSGPDGAGMVLVPAFRGGCAPAWASGPGDGVIEGGGNMDCIVFRSLAGCGVERC